VVLKVLKIPFLLAALPAFGLLAAVNAAANPALCGAEKEACLESCKPFEADDEKFSVCKNSCQILPERCAESPPAPATAPISDSPAVEPPPSKEPQAEAPAAPTPLPATSLPPTPAPSPLVEDKTKKVREPKNEVALGEQGLKRELKKNEEMLDAIRGGDLKTIRQLIEVVGLSPTYVYAYDRDLQTGLYKAKAFRLRLSDIFNDTNLSHSDASGLDRVLALFMELGMDVKATIATRTAWGPNFRAMEGAKDRASRLRALDMALLAGLVPNDDIGERLFAELPQICGRDKSQFAIQVVDVLIKYLGPSLKDYFRRAGERGPETITDVLDRSYSSHQPKNAREKELFAQQDQRWENCAPLSRRITRFMTQGK